MQKYLKYNKFFIKDVKRDSKMCGIFALFSANPNMYKAFATLKQRGPDTTKIINYQNFWFGFHRLRINDLLGGMQPFEINDIILICNGEIYNHETLTTLYLDNIVFTSSSDCEIIIYLYQKLGMVQTLELLDGVFSFILYDKCKKVGFACRDRIGVRPLYIGGVKNHYAFASEAKALESLKLENIHQVPPASMYTFDKNAIIAKKSWWSIPSTPKSCNETLIISVLRNLLIKAVQKRLMSDRAIGCLLSGGLDSSVIVSILAKYGPVNTFSIGFKESTDLKYARMVANYHHTNHHEIIITHEEALNAIPKVIQAIESYDITTVRACVGMYLLSKKIKEKYPDTVIFSGRDRMKCYVDIYIFIMDHLMMIYLTKVGDY